MALNPPQILEAFSIFWGWGKGRVCMVVSYPDCKWHWSIPKSWSIKEEQWSSAEISWPVAIVQDIPTGKKNLDKAQGSWYPALSPFSINPGKILVKDLPSAGNPVFRELFCSGVTMCAWGAGGMIKVTALGADTVGGGKQKQLLWAATHSWSQSWSQSQTGSHHFRFAPGAQLHLYTAVI